MLTEDQRAAFEREFGLRPSTSTGELGAEHADMERTVVRNELSNLRHRLNHARVQSRKEDAAKLEEEWNRKVAIARECDRL